MITLTVVIDNVDYTVHISSVLSFTSSSVLREYPTSVQDKDYARRLLQL